MEGGRAEAMPTRDKTIHGMKSGGWAMLGPRSQER